MHGPSGPIGQCSSKTKRRNLNRLLLNYLLNAFHIVPPIHQSRYIVCTHVCTYLHTYIHTLPLYWIHQSRHVKSWRDQPTPSTRVHTTFTAHSSLLNLSGIMRPSSGRPFFFSMRMCQGGRILIGRAPARENALASLASSSQSASIAVFGKELH